MLINSILIHTNLFIIDNSKATIIITHGIAEHSEYYQTTALKLNEAGYNVMTYDVRGHGRSQGKRGTISSYYQFLSDLHQLVNYAKQEYQQPIYLIGHSMGGVISSGYVCKYDDVAGVIISAAPTLVPKNLKIFSIIGYRWLGHKKFETNFDDPNLSYLPKVFEVDPFALKSFKFKLIANILIRGTKYINRHVKNYLSPTLMLYGSDDKLVSYHDAKGLFEKIPSVDKTFKLYPNSKHNLFNEQTTDLIIEDIIKWLNERIIKI